MAVVNIAHRKIRNSINSLSIIIFIFSPSLTWSCVQETSEIFIIILCLGVFDCFVHLLPPVKLFFHRAMLSVLHHQWQSVWLLCSFIYYIISILSYIIECWVNGNDAGDDKEGSEELYDRVKKQTGAESRIYMGMNMGMGMGMRGEDEFREVVVKRIGVSRID